MTEISLRESATSATPSVAVIWLHGLGADGSDFVPIVPELGLPPATGVRFIFPDAPYRPVTCNGGYVMRAWYDILSLAPENRQIDLGGLLESRTLVRQLIEREIARGIPARRIFLAGFSQGGAVAYVSGLTHPERLAGIIALSTYLPAPELVTEELSPANRGLPIFVAHGSADDVVSPALGQQAFRQVSALGHAAQWHAYPMPHAVCPAEIADLGHWLGERIRQLDPSAAAKA